MLKKIFLTFSTKRDHEVAEVASLIAKVLESNKSFQIANKWFVNKTNDSEEYQIYENSIKALLNSNLIIAEVSTPSTGVGQQIAYGMFHKIPVLVLAKSEFKEKTGSLFLKGTKSTLVTFYYYKNKEDLLKNIIALVNSKLDNHYEKLNFIATKSIKKFLEKESQMRKISQSELLRQIITEWKDNQ